MFIEFCSVVTELVPRLLEVARGAEEARVFIRLYSRFLEQLRSDRVPKRVFDFARGWKRGGQGLFDFRLVFCQCLGEFVRIYQISLEFARVRRAFLGKKVPSTSQLHAPVTSEVMHVRLGDQTEQGMSKINIFFLLKCSKKVSLEKMLKMLFL